MACRKRRNEGQKRGSAWTDNETICLLGIWGDNCIEEQLESPKTNNCSIYKTVASEMAEKDFEKTPDQCKVRIHTLKRSYRECKTSMKKSGKGRKTCKFDVILGSRPASSPLKVIDTLRKKAGIEETDKSDNDDDEDIQVSVDDELGNITPLELEDDHSRENGSSGTKDRKDEGSVEKRKKEESADKVKIEKKRVRKTRLEVALKSVMDGFGAANEKAEDKFVDIERRKLDMEKERLELEKAKIESEERQKREEREHQFNMMKMIMGAVGQRQTGQPHPAPTFPVSHIMPSGEDRIYRGQGPSLLPNSSLGQSFVSTSSWPSTDTENQEEGTFFNL